MGWNPHYSARTKELYEKDEKRKEEEKRRIEYLNTEAGKKEHDAFVSAWLSDDEEILF